jgi:hypothetical protein
MASRPPRYPTWTGIAARERDSENVWVKVTWISFPDAFYSPAQAMTLCKLGKLLVSHHHDDEHVTMMVKSPRRSS